MKIALVHELLTMRGGAERVLKILAETFPDAPIYTLLYDEGKFGDWFPRDRIRTSTLHRFAWLSTNHHLYLPWFPEAVESWDFSEFDLVISTSSAFAHGIITNGKPKHLCYVNSPARYFWDRTHEVLAQTNPLLRWYAAGLFHRLRIWDSETADRPDKLLAASKTVQRRIELYWRRDSEVIYPPIDDFWLEESAQVSSLKSQAYFVIVSTLARYKRIDIAIEACNQLKVKLKIAGEGADARRLKKISGPTIEFLGHRPQEEIKSLYADAQATIFPGEEDFGLVPLESMACGTPVIAYRSGGALETVIEGKTGEFFNEPTAKSLSNVLKNFNKEKYSADACMGQAKKFSRKEFEQKIKNAIEALTN